MRTNQKGAIDITLAATLLIVVAVGAFVLMRISSSAETTEQASSQSDADLPLNTFIDADGNEQTVADYQDCIDWAFPTEEREGVTYCVGPDGIEFAEPEPIDYLALHSEFGDAADLSLPEIDTTSSKVVEIESLGLSFTSLLNSEILVSEGGENNRSSVYLTTQSFLDFVDVNGEELGGFGDCANEIAAIAVLDSAEELNTEFWQFLYDEYFDEEGQYIGASSNGEQYDSEGNFIGTLNTIIPLNDGRYVHLQKQSQAVCVHPIHTQHANLILQQLGDIKLIES